MPTVTTPDGRKLKFPEGTSQEQVLEVLRSQGYDIPGPAGPAGLDPGLLAAPPGGPGGHQGAAPSPGATGAPTPAPAASGAPPVAPDAPTFNPTDGMSMGELALAGFGQHVDSRIRGVRQIWNKMVGDDAKLAELNDEEARSRELDAPLLSTAAGRLGQMGGYLAEAIIPGGAAAKGLQAANAGRLAYVGAEAGLGGLQGYLDPTVKGESRVDNAKVGAMIGAAVPAAAPLLRSARNLPMTPLSAVLRAAAPRGAGSIMDLVARVAKEADTPAKKAAGDVINSITSGATVKMDNALVAKLRQIRMDYRGSLPRDVRRKVDDLIELAKQGNLSMKGSAVQEFRAALASGAQDVGGLGAKGMQSMVRTLDDAMYSSLSPKLARTLRAAREQYRSGVHNEMSVLPRPRGPGIGGVVSEAVTRPVNKRAAQRAVLQSLITGTRSPVDQEE